MCIGVFIWKAHPLHPLILLLNRDEYHRRPTTPLSWWDDDDDLGNHVILGGRDEVAGGTWLACNVFGKLAFLTNVREVTSSSDPSRRKKSRGQLPLRFLQSKKSVEEFADELVRENNVEEYNGSNLIIADLGSLSMFYITNRPKSDGVTATRVSPGIHVLSNAKLDTPWPKAQRLEKSFKSLMDKYGEREIPLEELCEEPLMKDSTKDEDESKLPGICAPEWEHQLSSIFVDTETPMGRCGTRSISTLITKTCGEMTFSENYIDTDGLWKERTISFNIGEKKLETI
ncbi:OLC1v1013963C1 [Oldenlandia corymbosa var. corymbosa]|uniref:OLC1v1013963C1 n=1 Tax=Oldenlandia corymbosa var. corymbosa TaxID=529605 RepID=A0AAV1DZK4_OLDCO|nr:OLC1v1013963C1 [Oldenlandia corymbosa var. corymbosa]